MRSRRFTLGVVGALFLLLLTGCSLETRTHTTINQDLSGHVSVTYTGTGPVAELIRQTRNTPGGLPEDAQISYHEEGESAALTITQSFKDISDLNAWDPKMVTAVQETRGILFVRLEVEQRLSVADLDPSFLGPEAADALRLVYQLTLPGRITETNAHSYSGGNATWAFSQSDLQDDIVMRATATSVNHARLIAFMVGGTSSGVAAIVVRSARRGSAEQAGSREPEGAPVDDVQAERPEDEDTTS